MGYIPNYANRGEDITPREPVQVISDDSRLLLEKRGILTLESTLDGGPLFLDIRKEEGSQLTAMPWEGP